MEENPSDRKCSSLLLSALRLLVPPVRLVSAAIWQTIQQKNVADYWMLEEFVSMVTEIVPELLNSCQRAQLLLGLRARLILELCQCGTESELLQPHLDRVRHLIHEWATEAGAADVDLKNPEFVDLIKKLITDPKGREHFFQNVFPEEFGSMYDEALHRLMWTFLSRLEEFLPHQTFHQVASSFGDISSVLEDCVHSVSQGQELKTLLQYQQDVRQLDQNDNSSDGSCIISALKLHSAEKRDSFKTQPQATNWEKVLLCASDLERDPLTLIHEEQVKTDAEGLTSEVEAFESRWSLEENGTAGICQEKTSQEGNVVEELQSQPLKQCHVLLERVDVKLSVQRRPVRANRGARMKEFLLKEKRNVNKSAPASKKTQSKDLPEVLDNENSSSNDSWSYYSDNSFHKASSPSGSWSEYSDEAPFEPPGRSDSEGDSSSSCSNQDSFLTASKNVSNVKSSTTKRKVECFICKKSVNTYLKVHMKTHFPTGDYACPRCDSRFRFFTTLKQHLKRTCFEHGQRQLDPERPDEAKYLYKCDKCEEAFWYKVSLDKHKQTHDELYCSVCRKVLQDAATLARHKASHTPYQCTRCDETFTLFKPLFRHCQNVHKMKEPFSCIHCGRTLSKLHGLITHEWKHTGHHPFQCAQCGIRVRTDSDLVSHQRVHTREKPYLCAECGKTFSQRSNLVRHLNLLHGEARNEKKYSCSECDKSFKEKGALKKHQRSRHFEALKQLFRHPCQYCGKMISASTIARHKLIHTGERPYKCSVLDCERTFRSTSEVKRHVLVRHSTERPFKCDECGKGFVKKFYLNAHAKIHTGEKPFVCHCCGKAFPKFYSMQRHKRLVHTGEIK